MRPPIATRHWLSVAEAVVEGQADAVPFATIALNHLGRLQEQRRQYAAAESALAHSLRLNPRSRAWTAPSSGAR